VPVDVHERDHGRRRGAHERRGRVRRRRPLHRGVPPDPDPDPRRHQTSSSRSHRGGGWSNRRGRRRRERERALGGRVASLSLMARAWCGWWWLGWGGGKKREGGGLTVSVNTIGSRVQISGCLLYSIIFFCLLAV
jgi:hypothetical protein